MQLSLAVSYMANLGLPEKVHPRLVLVQLGAGKWVMKMQMLGLTLGSQSVDPYGHFSLEDSL